MLDEDNHGEIGSSVFEHTKPEDSRRIIDEHISRHERSIITLKSLRNTFSPISKIPTEILSQIFYFVCQDLSFPASSSLDWIKVSYVSRQWRNVAINSPNLWTNLPLDYRRWTEEMLERSKMASLTVKANFRVASNSAANQIILALHHIERVKVIMLDYASPSALMKITPYLSKSAPLLQTLVISVRPDPFQEDAYKLPNDILCETGDLRRLELVGCDISWDSPLLGSLSHLKIHNVSLAARPTTEELLELLTGVPNLEYLDLCGTLPVDGNHKHASLSVQRVIHLPRLQFLSLSSTTTEIRTLLQHISFLPTTTTTIVAAATPDSQSDFFAVISTLSSILCPSDNSPGLDIRSFVIESTGELDPGIRARIFSKPISDMEVLQLSSPACDVDLVFKVARQSGTFKEFTKVLLPQLFHAFPFCNLGKLFLLEDCQPDSQTIADTFGTLPRLRSIFATGLTTEHLLEALLCKPVLKHSEATSTSSKDMLSFPGLRSLSLEDITFQSDGHYGLPIDNLIDCLIARYELGGEVRELHLTDCSCLYEDDVQSLKEIVVNVQWDGVEQTPDEDESSYDHDYFECDHDDYDYGEDDEVDGYDDDSPNFDYDPDDFFGPPW